ncbi:MAG: serine hydrolase, partial [Nitrospirota bacterium]|nr:serine hydrolase [Nitrospirota bacterium]
MDIGSFFLTAKKILNILMDWSPIILFLGSGLVILLFMRTKEKFRKYSPLLLSFLIGISLGCLKGSDWLAYDKKLSRGKETHQPGYKFISPLLECEVTQDMEATKELKPFKHKIEAVIDEKLRSKKASHISVYFRDMNNGPWFGIKENEEFSPASLLKVPIMMAYFKMAETDPQALKKAIKYEGGGKDLNRLKYFKPSKAIEIGNSYTIDDLIYRMIIYSDDNAMDLLLQNIDVNRLVHEYTDLGIAVPNVRKPENFMPVKTYASFFRILYNASYLNREMSEKALDYLSMVDFKYGLVTGVPSNIVVAQKFGERGIIMDIKQLHDC